MIVGIGTDLVDMRRIERLMLQYPQRFERRIYTAAERNQASQRETARQNQSPYARYAKYFAAKEAAYKALGVGRAHGIGWQDFEVGYRANGQPTISLSSKASALLPRGHALHVSLCDEYPYAQAFVVISVN